MESAEGSSSPAASVYAPSMSSTAVVILSQTGIVFNTGSSITGRALAQTAVTLDATAVTQP